MPFYSRRSITLIELLIAIVLLAVIILAINNIDIFSRYHFISTDRRSKLQNDVSYCLEHISKNVARAIGNESFYGSDSAVYTPANNLSIFIDVNNNGLIDAGTDYWARYKFSADTHKLTYCSQCPDSACASCSVSEEELAKDITAFSAVKDFAQGNYINLDITGCWDPAETRTACGTPDNPSVTMSTSINLPSVATN